MGRTIVRVDTLATGNPIGRMVRRDKQCLAPATCRSRIRPRCDGPQARDAGSGHPDRSRVALYRTAHLPGGDAARDRIDLRADLDALPSTHHVVTRVHDCTAARVKPDTRA